MKRSSFHALRPRRRAILVAAATGAAVLMPVAPALAATPALMEDQTVAVELSPTGEVQHARLITQLTALGHGQVDVLADTSTRGLRNLNGFSSPSVSAGEVRYKMAVDGTGHMRTVADFDRKLPLAVRATYYLNDKQIDPQDAVGKTGVLRVMYQVKNTTATPTKITFPDGSGKQVTETANIVTPLVGQLTTTLPSSYTNIVAPRADIAGDGRGGAKMTWTMVLFEPVGQNVQEFGWKARINGGDIPAATVQAVPVPPERKPELKFAQDAFADGATAAGQLSTGVVQIDANLKKLQSGTSQLLDGLNQLSDGAAKLHTGLADQVVPGAGKIATGLKALSSGLDQMAATDGLPAAYAGLVALRTGIDQIVAALGSPTDTSTVLGGLTALAAGNTQMKAGVDQLSAGATALVSPTAGLPAAKAGIDQIKAGMDASLAAGGSIDQLVGGVNLARATAGCAGDATCAATLAAISAGLGGTGATSLRSSTTAAAAALGQVSAGLAAAVAGIGSGSSPAATTLRGGLTAISAGLAASGTGLTQLITGVTQLKGGLSSGSAENPGIAEGMDALVDGIGAAVTGLGLLANGSDQLYTGTAKLHSGLEDVATGAGKLADGTKKAAEGAAKVPAGIGQLEKLGMQPLATGAGKSAKDYARQQAIMETLANKARTSSLPYKPPAGASGNAAYSYELASASDAGSQNAIRALGALLVFGAGAMVGNAMRKRRVAGRSA